MIPGFRIITSQKLRLAAFAVFASLWIVGAVPATSPCPPTCTLPDCQCASKEIPGGLRRDQVPQMVTISFDDAIRVQDYEMFYSKILQGRRNRNGCDLPLTFFVSHRNTDYSLATELANDGHELAVHSVTHRSPTTFWSEDRNNTDELTHEILDMRDILSRWAHVPKSNVVGYRTPFLASSENQLKILHENDFLYDCTMVTNEMYWPFTLDYKSPICSSPAVCPEESLPGLWVIPNINKVQNSSFRCSMIDSCIHPPKSTREHWMHFFMHNFERHYNNSKAPFGLYAHASWFYFPDSAQRLQAFMDFLDYLGSLEDVYIVTMSQLIAWSRNPTPLDQLSTFEPWQCPDISPTTCTHTDQNICKYTADGEDYFIRLCRDDNCPEMYPNITNPQGASNIVVSTPTSESVTGPTVTSTSSVNSISESVSSSTGASVSPSSHGVSSHATGTPSSATVTVHSTFASVTPTSSEIDSTSIGKPPSATVQSTSTLFTSTSSAVSFTSTGTSSSTTVDSTPTSGSVTTTSTAIDSTSTGTSSSMTVDSTSTSELVTSMSSQIDSTSTGTSSSTTVDSKSSELVNSMSSQIDSTSTGTSSSMTVRSTSNSGSDTLTSTPSQVTTTDPINMDTTSIQSSETRSNSVLETASISTFESDSASAYKSATLLLSPSSTVLATTNGNTIILVASTSSPGAMPSVTVNTETDTNSAGTGDSSGSLEAGAAAGLAIGIVLLVAILVSAVLVAVAIGYVKWKRAHSDPSVHISSNPGPFYYNPRARITM